LANLQHKKTCPSCGTSYGNAKRGTCRGRNGTCTYEFVLSKRAKTAAKHPPKVEMRPCEGASDWQKINSAFQQLRAKANRLAAESGWSIVVMAAGISDGSCQPHHAKHHQTSAPQPQLVQVGVLSEGMGGSASDVAANPDVMALYADLTCQQLDNAQKAE